MNKIVHELFNMVDESIWTSERSRKLNQSDDQVTYLTVVLSSFSSSVILASFSSFEYLFQDFSEVLRGLHVRFGLGGQVICKVFNPVVNFPESSVTSLPVTD